MYCYHFKGGDELLSCFFERTNVSGKETDGILVIFNVSGDTDKRFLDFKKLISSYSVRLSMLLKLRTSSNNSELSTPINDSFRLINYLSSKVRPSQARSG